MHMAARPSAPELAPFVDWIGYFAADLPHGREVALPTGATQLLIPLVEPHRRQVPDREPVERLPGAALQGPYDRPVLIDTADQRAIAYVAFHAAGAAPFLTAPASAVAGSLVELDALWGRDGATLAERLRAAPNPRIMLRELERFLLARLLRPHVPDPAVAFAARALDRGTRVGTVADRLGLTPRSFGRRFTAQVGLGPKRFARIRRFQRLLGALPADTPPDWARLAVECGFYDQAHLSHEFRELSGVSPTAYRPRTPHERNHVLVAGADFSKRPAAAAAMLGS
jgi:AraC-like DNA-binding protein